MTRRLCRVQDHRRPIHHARHIEISTFAAVVFWLAPPAWGGPEHDGPYVGTIACDVIPGQTVQSLKTDFSMKVVNGQAEYEREVLRPSGGARLGVTERGTGTVSASGEVSLTGSASGQTWSYEAAYRGRVDGRSLRLSGAQVWRLPHRSAHSRPCQIAVSRQ